MAADVTIRLTDGLAKIENIRVVRPAAQRIAQPASARPARRTSS